MRADSADPNDVRSVPEAALRLLDDMQMVREQDRLNAVAHSRERFETVAGSEVVKAGENVVADERGRLGAGGIVLGIGKP